MSNFYVYKYLREDGTPYYIGKGKHLRAYYKQTGVKPPKDKSRIQFISENMNEEDAFQAEMFLIFLYGRKDIGTGCLRNMTDGGEGSSGRILTEQQRLNISIGHLGLKNPHDGHSMLGKKHTEKLN